MSGILTLRFDPISQQHFEDMRRRHFPPERNLVPAHLTLFHTLPVSEESRSILQSAAAETKVFAATVTGLRFLGRGVAYNVAAQQLLLLHQSLASSFAAYLSLQDQQKFQPHVVIQNKSTGEEARALLAMLQAQFQSFAVEAHGLDLWHYRDGPWELAEQFHFIPKAAMHPGAGENSQTF